jgi:hypothetical protein
MYKCIHAVSHEEIVILLPIWRNRVRELRKMDSEDLLVCQGCHQPVRVRAGHMRRWHFAHKHLQNCPFHMASMAVLNARAFLFEWFVSQFGQDAVDLEVLVPGVELPRPIDVWISLSSGRFGYWVIDVRMQPRIRQGLHNAIAEMGIPVHYIFVQTMLKQNEFHPEVVYLTTTEREFAAQTDFDLLIGEIDRPAGKTLHYLDVENQKMTTLRDLHCIHSPQVFQGKLIVNDLKDLLVDQVAGGLAHPGEPKKLEQLRSKITQRKEKLTKARQSMGRILDRMLPKESDLSAPNSKIGTSDSISVPEIQPVKSRYQTEVETDALQLNLILNKMAICMFCGQETEDWWYLDRGTGKCKCRGCLKQGIS